jgi:hypothetical protein
MLLAARPLVRLPMRLLDFSIGLIHLAHYVPGVQSTSNTNEYQKSSLGVKGGRRVRLTASLPFVSRDLIAGIEQSVLQLAMGWTTEGS